MWFFLVGLVVIIGTCAGVYLWPFYDSKVINIIELYTGVGVIFSSIGAIATVFVFRSTAQATKNAIKSVEIAEKNLRESREHNKENLKVAEFSLKLSHESSRKDDFIKQFILLLDLHGKSHEVMIANIDKNNVKIISSDYDGIIRWSMKGIDAADKIYQNHLFSPYMRMLYQVLKHIDNNFYLDRSITSIDNQKKRYASIVRSTIRNDVLFFIAINAMNKRDVFNKYKSMLTRFSFFEHLITDEINETINFNLKTYSPIVSSIDHYYDLKVLSYTLNNKVLPSIAKYENARIEFYLPVVLMIDLMQNYAKDKLIEFVKKIEDLINLKEPKHNIDEWLSRNKKEDNIYYEYRLLEKYQTVYGDYVSSDYKMIKGSSHVVSELSKLIVEENLTLDNFELKFKEEIFFSYKEYSDEDEDESIFIDLKLLYQYCIDYIRYSYCENENENENERLIEKMNSVIIEKLNETELVKNGIVSILKKDNGTINLKVNNK